MGGDIRLPREQVLPVAMRLYEALAPVCDCNPQTGKPMIVIAGSLRRKRPDVGDVEIVAVPHLMWLPGLFEETHLVFESEPSRMRKVIDGLIEAGELAWDTQVRRNGPSYKRFVVPALGGMPFELFLCAEEEFGYQTMIRTGSAAFTKAMMTERAHGGLKPAHIDCRGGATVMENGRKRALMLHTERQVFEAWRLPILPPEERDEAGIETLRRMAHAAR